MILPDRTLIAIFQENQWVYLTEAQADVMVQSGELEIVQPITY